MKQFEICGLGNAIVDIFLELSDDEFGALGFERGTMRLVEPAEQKQLLERFQFVSLQLADRLADDALQPGSACKAVSLDKVSELPPSWKAGWVPPGFELNQALQRTSPASSEPVASLLYGDGLARFTVFLEPLRGVGAEDARSQLGPTAVVSRRMSTADGDVMVTVVGEIPLGTAERVALSMQPAGAVEASAP